MRTEHEFAIAPSRSIVHYCKYAFLSMFDEHHISAKAWLLELCKSKLYSSYLKTVSYVGKNEDKIFQIVPMIV